MDQAHTAVRISDQTIQQTNNTLYKYQDIGSSKAKIKHVRKDRSRARKGHGEGLLSARDTGHGLREVHEARRRAE
eukprot:7529281-Heterocapsa_arctica.AAC.1